MPKPEVQLQGTTVEESVYRFFVVLPRRKVTIYCLKIATQTFVVTNSLTYQLIFSLQWNPIHWAWQKYNLDPDKENKNLLHFKMSGRKLIFVRTPV
jgi:hypothetical protein